MKKLREILAPLINEDADFVEEHGETCLICVFPLKKEIRTKAVDQAIETIKSLLLTEEEILSVINSTKLSCHELYQEAISKALKTAQEKKLMEGI